MDHTADSCSLQGQIPQLFFYSEWFKLSDPILQGGFSMQGPCNKRKPQLTQCRSFETELSVDSGNYEDGHKLFIVSLFG